MIRAALLIVLLSACSAQAATLAVAPAATGDGSGSDWTNRAQWSTLTFARGNTYCLMEGSYGTKSYATANSAASIITIKKATTGAAECTGLAGWTSTLGDGQAVLSGGITLQTDYWTFDGVTRNEADWNDETAYGFLTTSSIYTNSLSFGHASDNITIRYLAVTTNCSGTGVPCDRSVYMGGFGETADNWIIHRSLFFDAGEMNMPGTDNTLLEYSYFRETYGKECIRGQVRTTAFVLRYTVFHNCCRDDLEPGTGCTAEVGLFANQGDSPNFEGFRAYGNIIRKTINQHKTDASIKAQASDCLIYNNSIYDNAASGTSALGCTGGGGSVRNNIFYLPNGMTDGCTGTTCDNNSTYTASPPFVNVVAGDFHLTGALAGVSLSSPYNQDMDGVTRGADGTFDRGAFEYASGGAPDAPKNFRLVSVIRSALLPCGPLAFPLPAGILAPVLC